jgi:hypothetical protein
MGTFPQAPSNAGPQHEGPAVVPALLTSSLSITAALYVCPGVRKGVDWLPEVDAQNKTQDLMQDLNGDSIIEHLGAIETTWSEINTPSRSFCTRALAAGSNK